MSDALHDRWMPRSRVMMNRDRASREAEQARKVAAETDRQARRKALPGYDGERPEHMQGALRLR
jgi:hypothetical protein